MIDRCNKANVRIYVDAVINHMTTDSANPIGTGGSTANPSNLSYPAVPYTYEDFHEPCEITDWNDANAVRNCELGGLHDLDQSREDVRSKIVDFFNRAVDLGVAGFRYL